MLQKLIARVVKAPPAFSLDELYRICVVIKNPQDPLQLQQNAAFVRQLAQQYGAMDLSAVPPFQKSLLEETLRSAITSDSATDLSLSKAAGAAVSDGPTALECLTAIWSLIDEAHQEKTDFSGPRMQSLEQLMSQLEGQMRKLSPSETVSLVKALSSVHYRNYQQVALISRRGCEVSGQLSHQEACQLYYNLSKLHCMDSLTPLVNRIVHFEKDLTAKDTHLVAQALERQTNSSFAGGKLLTSILSRASVIAKKFNSPSCHRSFLSAAARYGYNRHGAIPTLLNDLHRLPKKQFTMKELTVLLRSMTALAVPASHPMYKTLVGYVTESVGSVELRHIDGLMDVLSETPVDSSSAMMQLMKRLEVDAGKLSIPQLARVLQLLSSYPPARGSVCVVSLSFAAAMRSESFEREVLVDVLLSLADLEHFTDDFFTVMRTLFQKGGFQKYDHLHTILCQCPPAVLRSPDGEELARQGILQLAPMLNDGELQECRKLLVSKGIDDKVLHQKIMTRAKQLQRGASFTSSNNPGNSNRRGGGRRQYDPMDDLIQ